jgi:hypothetical protein
MGTGMGMGTTKMGMEIRSQGLEPLQYILDNICYKLGIHLLQQFTIVYVLLIYNVIYHKPWEFARFRL